jgi:hypothetical protein
MRAWTKKNNDISLHDTYFHQKDEKLDSTSTIPYLNVFKCHRKKESTTETDI